MIQSDFGGVPSATMLAGLKRPMLYAGATMVLAGAAIATVYVLNRAPLVANTDVKGHTFLLSSEAVPVMTALVQKGTLIHHLATSGTLRACREVEIQARVGGALATIGVFNGSYVDEGDTMAAIENREFRVAYDRARTGLLNAQIEYRTLSATPFLAATDSLETARRIIAASHLLDSLRTRYRCGDMDEATYVRLSRDHESAIAYLTANRGDVIAGKSGLAAAREAFETARLNLEWTSVTAPFSGFVADCFLTPGMHVNAGQPLMRLLDLSTLLVDVEVLENETGRIAVGQRTRAHLAGFPGREFKGSVLYMNPLVDPKTKTMKVTIALRDGRHYAGDPRPSLRPGMFATVHIETDVHPHRLLVPRSALLVRDERPLVFTVEDGRAKWHYVETGEANDELLEIKNGLAPGDTVIVDGHYTLAHDAPVSVTRRSP